jgi:type IV pilus assembly protein PilB
MFGRSKPTTTVEQPANDPNVLHDPTVPDELQSLYQPSASRVKLAVEQLLLERKHITEEQLVQAKKVQSQTPGKSLAQVLLTMGAAGEAQILSAIADTLGLPYETPERAHVEAEAFGSLDPDFIRKQLVLPMRYENGSLIVAMTDPNNVFLIDEVKRKTKKNIRVVVTTGADINRIVEQMTAQVVDVKVDEIIKDMADDDVQVVKEDNESDTDLAKAGNEARLSASSTT